MTTGVGRPIWLTGGKGVVLPISACGNGKELRFRFSSTYHCCIHIKVGAHAFVFAARQLVFSEEERRDEKNMVDWPCGGLSLSIARIKVEDELELPSWSDITNRLEVPFLFSAREVK